MSNDLRLASSDSRQEQSPGVNSNSPSSSLLLDSSSSDTTMHTLAIKRFIFGYGSLMNPHSRGFTVADNALQVATPVQVRGLQRVWSKRSSRLGMTAMSIRLQPEASCVGVLVPVTAPELKQFDIREEGYDRVRVELDQVQKVPFLEDAVYQDPAHRVFLDAKSGKSNTTEVVEVWVYVRSVLELASKEAPLVQSYVDTILRGCYEVGGEKFAEAFMQDTLGWHPGEVTACDSSSPAVVPDATNVFWVDDREHPIYPRGDKEYSLAHAAEFDRVIQTYKADSFEHRIPIDPATASSSSAT